MDQSLLSSRAIIGMYYARLEQNPGTAWLAATSNLFGSDQASETYNWLGSSPTMREWVASRRAYGFTGAGITIVNKQYESTIEIKKKDLRRDKTGQIVARIGEWTDRANTHWASLVSQLILDGASSICYDGQYFFDTDHSEGDSGVQSNSISADISAYPVSVHGTTTVPSKEEMQHAIFDGVKAIVGLKDDRGEPMNEGAREFLVMVPLSLYGPAKAAITPLLNPALPQNMDPNLLADFRISVAPNLRLNAWTDKFVVIRTDSPIKPFIRQTEQEIELKAKAEGSEFEFDNDAWQFGIDGWRGAGYGYWQRACLVTLV